MEKNTIEKSLKTAIILTSIFFIVEVVGGLISGSLSLLGDAENIQVSYNFFFIVCD